MFLSCAGGFTHQYSGLQKLYADFKDKGLVMLGFPCNQFGAQEPGGPEEIVTFCSTKYQVDFPIMEKVRGAAAGTPCSHACRTTSWLNLTTQARTPTPTP